MPTTTKKKNVFVSLVLALFLLLMIVAIVFLLPEPTKIQENVVRFLIALDAAFFSYFFAGKVVFNGQIAAQTVSATAGFALFILIMFFWNPSDVKTYVADVAPSIVPSSPVIRDAQIALRDNGMYTGPITGKPDSATRNAIRSFQKKENQAPTGYVRSATKEILNR